MLHPFETTKQYLANGVMTTFAKSRNTWDPTYGTKLTDETWVDAADSKRAISRYDYDLSTGNLLFAWKPEQWAENPNPYMNLSRTTYSYDSRKLFTAGEMNEVGQQLDFVWEYGTGTKLETLGPKAPACAQQSPSTCPSGEPLKEDHRIRVDGIGRMIERYEAFAEDGGVYRSHRVEANSYIDGPQSSVLHQTAYELVGLHTNFRQERMDLDGHGRPILNTVFVFGSAPADQVTRYTYASDGTLVNVALPNPSANDATMVAYRYTFDSLGRPKTMRRPDASLPTYQSGFDIEYDGLTQTSTEVVGAAGGQRASSKTTNDVFGRLVEVQEQRGASPITWAVTSYAYSPDDNMKQITDAQGAVTALAHDQAGHRISITRTGKTWRYGYDKNGNMISQQTPCTPAGSCELNYTSTVAYDVLDRPVSKSNAPRNLSAADQDLFAESTETFIYDGDLQSMGQLNAWRSYAPGASTFTTQVSFLYNVQNQLETTTESTIAAGLPETERSFKRTYAIGGDPLQTWYGDSMGSSCPSGGYSETSFDARGLPSAVSIHTCNVLEGGNSINSVVNTRNVAGLVTKRHSQQDTAGPFTYVESNWTYDKLSRVTSQTVKSGASLAQVARQDLHYLGNDDIDTLDHWLGATNKKHFTYTYDVRHQLTNVAEAGNAFSATYDYGAAGRFASALEAAAALPNTNVKARNVTYVYSVTDPEQLVTLKKSNNQTFASYTYDLTGNELTRDYPDTKEHWDYVYDGKNQLRRATKKVNGAVSGSEEYWYDLDGNRMLVSKKDASGTRTEAIWFIGDTEAHYGVSGAPTRVFGHVTMGTPVFRMERSADAPSVGEYEFHGLANNTLAAVSNAMGTINASFDYAPFGEVVEATNAGGATDGLANHHRRMNDKFIDDIDELTYYGVRFYDRTSMTWTQSDPEYRFAPDAAWLEPRRSALYTLSLNNPNRYIDPDGRDGKKSVFADPLPVPTWPASQLVDGFVNNANHKLDQIDRAVNDAMQGNPTKDTTEVFLDFWLPTVDLSPHGTSPRPSAPSDVEARPTDPALPDSYWENKHAPTQVTPGVRELTDQKPSSSGTGVYNRTTYYDEYGREVGSTHETNHGRSDHANPHHHTRDPVTGRRSKGPGFPGQHPIERDKTPGRSKWTEKDEARWMQQENGKTRQ